MGRQIRLGHVGNLIGLLAAANRISMNLTNLWSRVRSSDLGVGFLGELVVVNLLISSLGILRDI